MSDSDESGVTYTDVSSPFEDLSDIGSLRANDHENLELPEMLKDPYVEVALQAPPSPDYIPDPEEPEQAPPSLDYVPCLEHADDEIVVEDQPYAKDASPTAQSTEYVPESDLEAHPEDDDDEDPEEDPLGFLFQLQYLYQLGLIQRLLDCLLCLLHHNHHYLLGLHHRHRFLF
nr:hypothetical protein [Tanacetum cinerariifolium]